MQQMVDGKATLQRSQLRQARKCPWPSATKDAQLKWPGPMARERTHARLPLSAASGRRCGTSAAGHRADGWRGGRVCFRIEAPNVDSRDQVVDLLRPDDQRFCGHRRRGGAALRPSLGRPLALIIRAIFRSRLRR